MHPQRQADQSRRTHKSENRSHIKAASAPHEKPQQGAKDLAAIERIDGQNVEDEQDDVDQQNPLEQVIGVGIGKRPSQRASRKIGGAENGQKSHVDQRPCGKAPQGGAGSLRRIDECDAAQRPEHDAVDRSTDLAASQGVAELVQ